MRSTYIPIELTNRPQEFLTQDGLSRSVWLLMERIWWELSNLTSNPQFNSSDIQFLAWEIEYHLVWGDWIQYSNNEDLIKLNELKGALNVWNLNWYATLYIFMKELIEKVWNASSDKMTSFWNWESKEVDNDNRLMASRTLLECVMIWTRIGIDAGQIEQWKSKLEVVHRKIADRYIYPKP
jgi:hypothetical protein